MFPDLEPYGAARLRGNDAANIYGATLANLPASVYEINDSDNDTVASFKGNIQTNEWNYRPFLTTDLQNLTGWTEGSTPFYPPVTNNGDKFTALSLLPLNNSFYTGKTDSLEDLYGYGGRPELPQPFAAENVVLLTDGICASGTSSHLPTLT